ncbi:2-phosphosulfolactate phosphatase [Algoriphagus sediminis]|uniref:Probable 2-phosphosulfolactate phosphatase n=1 Tax=Algoriphagus sediminis TaxID=3057113 RepID=A0ABT7Y8T0_9BACT|nr:2-phosphosulfolactate phosphatase [Algoriphagus sediminis]MDN3202649.1 2-phosphosulfolactate phosphatase [Algoriphagus sediminis]
MRNIEICLSPELIHLHDLKGKTVVVVDIFRATSTMVAALGNGIKEIRTFASLEECKSMKAQGYLIAGERNGHKVNGFDLGNSPLTYLDGKYAGEKLAMTTTNGTLALSKSQDAEEILIGAFPNFSTTLDYLKSIDRDILVHCAGWKGRFNLEDSLYAGALTKGLEGTHQSEDDASLALKSLFEKEGNDLKKFLSQASHAKRLQNHNIEADIDFCLQEDSIDLIGKFEKGALTKF